MTTVPAQSLSAPARAWVMAAARFMPGVCAVLMSSSLEWTTRTPSYFHFGLEESLIVDLHVGARAAAGSRRRVLLVLARLTARFAGRARLRSACRIRGANAWLDDRRHG